MWPCYVINLAKNVQRLNNSAHQLDAAGLTWHRIHAVNGWELSEQQIKQVYDARRNARDGRQPLVPPEIGCYLSHIAAWEQIAEGPEPGGFIFEDDFAADETLAKKLALLSREQDYWDMVKLFSFDANPPLEWDRPLGPFRVGIPYRVPTCLIGYGLTQSAAAHLVKHATPFFRPVDEDQKFVWETGLRVALILPPPILVGDQTTVTGTIGSERRGARSGNALTRGLRNLRYSLRYSWNLALHRKQERRRT